MTLSLIPMFVALGAVIFGVYYVQRNLSAQAENIRINALANKLYRAAGAHVYKIYFAIILATILVAVFLVGVFSFSQIAIGGFFLGILSSIAITHFVLFFMMRLNARLADRSARGLIDAFHSVFEGGNALGVFISGAVLLVVFTYYSSFAPPAEGLIGLALGGVLAALFIKVGVDFYAKAIFENRNMFGESSDPKEKGASRDPGVIVDLVAHNLRHGMGVLTDIAETIFLCVLGAILVAAFTFPGNANAAVLPLMMIGVGFISTTISGKLIKTGATVNISKNILFTVMSSVVLASLIAFPVILWVMSSGFQYNNFALWFTVSAGFLSAGFVAIFHHFYSLKKFNIGLSYSLVVFFFMFGFFSSFLLTGLYGVGLYASSIVALAPLYVALSILGSVSDSVNKIVDIADLAEERKRIIQKLNNISAFMRDGAATYFFVGALFTGLIYFYLYQRSFAVNFPEIELLLDSPIIFVGLFLGGIGLYGTITGMFYARKRMYSILRENSRKSNKERKRIEKSHYVAVTRRITSYITRAIMLPVFLMFVFPLVAASILRGEGFAGFLGGELLLAGFWGFTALLQHQGGHINKEEGSTIDSYGINQYGDTVPMMIGSALKATAVFSLLLIILFI